MAIVALGLMFVILITFVAILVIGGSAIMFAMRGLLRLFFTAPGPKQVRRDGPGSIQCSRPQCRTENASHARFCRRCGKGLDARGMRIVA